MTSTSLLHGIPLYLKGSGSTAYQAFVSAVLDRLGPTYGAGNVDHLGIAYLAGPTLACPGLPAHTLDLACAYAQTAASLASVAAVAPYVVDRRDVARAALPPSGDSREHRHRARRVHRAAGGGSPAASSTPTLSDEDRELFMVLLGQLDHGAHRPERRLARTDGQAGPGVQAARHPLPRPGRTRRSPAGRSLRSNLAPGFCRCPVSARTDR